MVRTVESCTGGTVTVALHLGDAADQLVDTGTLRMPVDLWLRLLGRLEDWPWTRVDRGVCAECEHPTHTGDDCRADVFVDGEPAACPCGIPMYLVPTHPQTPAEAHAADQAADATADRL